MKRPLRFCPVLYPPEGEEIEQCQKHYANIWANGFIPFLRTQQTINQETDSYLLVSPQKIMMGLVRVRMKGGGNRVELEDTWEKLCWLARKGYRARFTGGMASIMLRKPEGDGENFGENFVPRVKGG